MYTGNEEQCAHDQQVRTQLVNKIRSQQAWSKPVNRLQQCWYFDNLLQACHSQPANKFNCKTITSCWNNLAVQSIMNDLVQVWKQ
jgi:hypothetical protein